MKLSMPERALAIALGVCLVSLTPEILAAPSVEGLSLEAAIKALESEGLRVFYSSNLVKPSMRVLAQPQGADAREWLRALVEPHGLAIKAGPRDSVLIVAQPLPPAVSEALPERALARAEAPVAAVAFPAIDEMVVAASRYELARAADGQPFRLASTDLEALPDLGDDSLRAVQRLPGTATNGFNARTHVRGGEVGELLVRLDQLRLYDPYHLEDFQGIFGSIDPRIVSTMDVYTGGFPASFGDRMSGVVDVTSLAPSRPLYHEVGMSFFNASLLSAGRFDDDEGEWLVSVRRSNLDLLYKGFSKLPERPRYLDGFGKVAYRLSDRLRVAMNVLVSRDDVTLNDDVDIEESASSNQEDRYAWLRLEHTPTVELSGTTLIAHTTLAGERTGATAKPGVSVGWLTDRHDFVIDTLQSAWSWQPTDTPRWSAEFGGMLGSSRGHHDYRDSVAFDLLVDTPGTAADATRDRSVSVQPKGVQQALYGSVHFSPTEAVAMDIGARWDRQTLAPRHSSSLGPRLGLRYRLAQRTWLRVSAGRFDQTQAVNELQVSDGVAEFLAPQRSRHVVLGVEHEFGSGVQLRIEAFEKNMSRLWPRHENVLHSLTLLPELKPDRLRIEPESALARGFEALLSDGRAARLDWWVSYSYGWVRDRIDGADVARSWDQTHTWNGGLGWETPRWNLGMAASYRSGWPTTDPLGLSLAGDSPLVVTGPRNAGRRGPFRSLDLRATRIFTLPRGELSAFFELTNARNERNPCCTEFELESDDMGEPVLGLSRIDYLPRVPSLGFVWSF